MVDAVVYLPQLGTEFLARNIELEDIAQTSEEGFVDVVNEVSSENNDAGKSLYVIQQHAHIHVGIAICGAPTRTKNAGVLGEFRRCYGTHLLPVLSPKRPSASSKTKMASWCLASWKMASMFLVLSPTHLLSSSPQLTTLRGLPTS